MSQATPTMVFFNLLLWIVTETPNCRPISVLPFLPCSSNGRLNKNRIKSYISQSPLRLHMTTRPSSVPWDVNRVACTTSGQCSWTEDWSFLLCPPSVWLEYGPVGRHGGRHRGSERKDRARSVVEHQVLGGLRSSPSPWTFCVSVREK